MLVSCHDPMIYEFNCPIPGIVSIANDSVPQTNCSLSTNTEDGDGADFPLNVLLLITGFVLVFTDIASTALLCVINFKVQRCGVFAIVWYLSTTVVLVIWTAISVVHVSIVIPVWMDSKDTCDDLVVVMALLCVVYGGVLTVVYVAVVVVVLSYECNRSRKLKELH